jgi:prepilin-type N-terminal cleavage/methylation domain-containing protein
MTATGKHTEEGFSLLELTAVVAILGILVTIAIASFVVSAERSRRIACIHNQRVVDSALMQYQVENGKWPALLEEVERYAKWPSGPFATCASDPSKAFDYDPSTGEVACPNPKHAR